MTNKSYIPILAVLGAIMLVVVAAIAAPQSFPGRDFVYAQTIDDATLLDLELLNADDVDIMYQSGVQVGDPNVFSATRMTYSVRAPSETNKVTVNATEAATAKAIVTISPPDRDSAEGHQVNLRGGSNTVIKVTVLSEDGTVTETYTLTVYQVRTEASDNENLSTLRLSGATLSPLFASNKTSYTGRASYSTENITVSYTADIGAEVGISAVTVNDTVVDDADDDASGYQVDLTAGAVTTMTVTVTAEDQVADNSPDTKTYTVMIYRENLVKSDDPSLAPTNENGLVLSHGPLTDQGAASTPIAGFTFDPTDKSYPNVRVTNSVRAVTVAANTTHDGAVAVITPSDQDPETPGHQILLSAGAKTNITVEVTAEDGTTTDTYSVTIYRGRRVASGDADLSALNLSGMTLSPAFASNKTSYTGRVPYSTDETTVSYTADVGATVSKMAVVDGGTPVVDDDADDDASGYQVDLSDGAGAVTTITLTVTAEGQDATSQAITKAYTVMIYRENLVKSDDPSLAPTNENGLVLSDGPLTDQGAASTPIAGFTFDPTDKSYPNVRVTNSVDAVTVAANTTHDGAVAVITPSDQDSLTPDHQILLRAGVKTNITVEVTAEDGTTTDTYSVTIYRGRRVASGDADLSALNLSGMTLSPAFASNKTSYTGRVPYSTDETTVSYTADVGATVSKMAVVDGGTPVVDDDADDDASGYQVDLSDGAGAVTTITLTVTAEGQDATSQAITKAYTVMIYRENLPPSDNAILSALTLMGDDETTNNDAMFIDSGREDPTDPFRYAVGTKSYPNVRVTNGVHVVTVEATAHPGAVTVITPSDQDSLTPDHQVILGAAAKTNITIEVTAEDGITTDTYSLTIYRARRVVSNDAELSALSLSGVTLSPAFASDKDKYTGTASNSTQMTTVSYTADIGAQMVEISNGNIVDPADPTLDADAAAPGHQVRLIKGRATVITITVTAEAGVADPLPPPYIITVYREGEASSDATLQTLALSDLTLSPAFDPATTEYTAEVEEALATTTVEAMATHLRATVEGTGLKSLTAGVENTISVTVTAEDGTSQTYTVKVTVPSSDATLQTLTLSGITLSPAFDPATMMYTGEVEFTVRTTTVVATATHPDATVSEGTGEITLSEGENTISVTVTAEDGTPQTYTVMVTVTAERSSVATLQELTLSGITLSPAFDSTTTEYAAEVEYTVETTTVVAMPTHPGATVEGAGEMTLAEGDNTIIVTVTAEDGTSQETYTVTVTVGEAPPVEGTLLDRYDADDDNQISKDEAIAAINDYLFGEGDQQITKAQVLEVINLYLFG